MRLSKSYTHANARDGQILVEVLVALTIIALTLTASYLISVVSNELLLDKKLSDRAMLYAQEGMGAVGAIRDRDWFALSAGTHGLSFDGSYWNVSGTQDIIGNFTRQVIITDVASHTKKIEASIAWIGFPNISRTIRSISHITNWNQENLLFTSWLNPGTLGSADVDPGGNQGFDVGVDGSYVYITAYQAAVSKSDLFIFDITNPASPSRIRDFDSGDGLHRISVKKGSGYAFAISEVDTAGFKVIDIEPPASADIATTLDLPGSSVNVSVLAYGNYAYVGTQTDSGDEELIVVDITTPTSPSVVGSLEIGATVNAIAAYENRLYLATSHDNKEFIVVDISTPPSPSEIGSWDWSGSEDAFAIYAQSPSQVLIGRANASGGELEILNAANPASIASLGSFEVGADINDLIAVDWLAFLGTSHANQELTIVNITDPSNPTTHSTFNYPQQARGVDFEGEYVFAAVKSNDALRIMESQ